MSWQRYRRRHRVRQAVLSDLPRLGPTRAVARSRPLIDAEYHGIGEFLADVLVHWERTEHARIEAALELGEPADRARARLAAEGWAAPLLLAAFTEHPALRGRMTESTERTNGSIRQTAIPDSAQRGAFAASMTVHSR